MLYIDTINVNGTEYGVTTRGSAYPVACQVVAGVSSVVYVPEALDEDFAFAIIEGTDNLAWMRTGQSGSYEYTLVLLAVANAPETYTYEAPEVYPSE